MKNYNKILEAINRGIQLALDDFDDEEHVQNIKSKQVQNRDYTKEYLDLLRDEVVDLGLPSGTLWSKYNLGVNPNQLSKVKDWNGDYYAFGELEPNKINEEGELYYDWDNYKFGDYNKLTKYCDDADYGLNRFTDNLTELQPEDDVAYQNKKFYNFKFHIPTKEQFEELINYTNNYWINNYDPNKWVHDLKDDKGIQGLNGRVFVGKNENQIFIPAAGCCNSSDINDVSSDCYLWSSSLQVDPCYAINLLFYLRDIKMDYSSRCFGYPIRPVINL